MGIASFCRVLKVVSLLDEERLIHARTRVLGGMLFDRDAVYIDLPNWKVRFNNLRVQIFRL